MDVLNATGVPNGFALQLCHGLTGSSTASKQGNMWIGGYDSTFTTSAMKYVAITADEWYVCVVNQFTVNGAVVSGITSINNPMSIIDSGTTLLSFNTQTNFNSFVTALQNAHVITLSSSLSSSQVSAFWAGTTGFSASAFTFSSVPVTISFKGTAGEDVPINIPLTNLFPNDGGYIFFAV